jgi:hypothetical protein
MARASYIYLVGPDVDGGLYAFTVKHEAQSFVARHRDGEWAKTGTIRRFPDWGAYGASGRTPKTWSVPEFLEE